MSRSPAVTRPRRSSIRALFAVAAIHAAVLLLAAPAGSLGAQITDRARLVTALDSAARAHVEHPMVAGISVAVVRGRDTLLMKGYGLADMEWSVPTPADASASYEIGSVTKQFTATAILQLVEQGKLDLDEDFTKYLPDYDSHGHRIPLRRLLDHTSGIRGYTEMPVFGELAMKKLPRDSLVSLVESEPLDFEPGTAQIYNNSAFFLLGLIIEKVSGESYEDYIGKHVFGPAGMTSSYYCSESKVHERKAHGYDGGPNGLVLKGYLDHTWPFAAGSLCSTAGDLVRWNQSLHGGRILTPASYTAMTTPMPLIDGTALSYGMGIGVGRRGADRRISHGGGINGYVSDLQYFPDQDLTIVVLQNSTGPQGAGALGGALAGLILGPVPPPTAVPFTGDPAAFVGEYAGPARGAHMHMIVSRVGDRLAFRGGTPEQLARPVPAGQGAGGGPTYVGNNEWAAGGTTLRFVVADGKATELRMIQGSGIYVLRRVK